MWPNGDVELDQDSHFVVLVCRVRQFWIQRILFDEHLGVEIAELLVELLLDLLEDWSRCGESQSEVFNQLRGKELWRDSSIMEIPCKGISQLDLVPVYIKPYRHQLLDLVGLLKHLLALDPQPRCLSVPESRLCTWVNKPDHPIRVSIAIAIVSFPVEATGWEELSILCPHLPVVIDLISHVHIGLSSPRLIIQYGGGMQEVSIDVLLEENLVEVGFGPLPMRQDRRLRSSCIIGFRRGLLVGSHRGNIRDGVAGSVGDGRRPQGSW